MFRQSVIGLAFLALATPAAAQDEGFPHEVRTTKFTIVDVDASKSFYEDLIGLKEVNRCETTGLVEPFMAFDEQGGRIGLLAFTEHENIEKTPLPVSVVSVSDLDPVLALSLIHI